MPNFLEDVSKQLNKTDFNKEFLGIFVRNGFGALPKREIELTSSAPGRGVIPTLARAEWSLARSSGEVRAGCWAAMDVLR